MGIAAIPLALGAAGTALTAYGEYQAGKTTNDAAKYNAAVLEREAKAREQKASYDSRRQAEAASRLSGSIRAGLGGSGAVMTEGSPLMIQSEQAEQSELENLLIGYEGATEAQYLRSRAEQEKYSGKVAKKAGTLGAITTLLTGFGTLGLNQGKGAPKSETTRPNYGSASQMTQAQKTSAATQSRY